MKSNLILHIGAPKTGTTALQAALKRETRLLRSHKCNPVFLFSEDSRFFAELFSTISVDSHYLKMHNLTSGIRLTLHFGKKLPRIVSRLALSTMRYRTTVISSEHLSQRISDVRQISDLKRVLGKFFKQVDVVYYKRDQDDFVKSLYWEALKAGNTLTLKEYSDGLPKHLNSEWVAQSWSEVFGKTHFKIREYSKDGDTTLDFFEAVLKIPSENVQALEHSAPARRTNERPTQAIYEEIRTFNESHPDFDENGTFLRVNKQKRHKLIESLRTDGSVDK